MRTAGCAFHVYGLTYLRPKSPSGTEKVSVAWGRLGLSFLRTLGPAAPQPLSSLESWRPHRLRLERGAGASPASLPWPPTSVLWSPDRLWARTLGGWHWAVAPKACWATISLHGSQSPGAAIAADEPAACGPNGLTCGDWLPEGESGGCAI
jgi:hypothetical protein